MTGFFLLAGVLLLIYVLYLGRRSIVERSQRQLERERLVAAREHDRTARIKAASQ